MELPAAPTAYWSLSTEALYRSLGSRAEGLTAAEAGRRRALDTHARLPARGWRTAVLLFFRQFRDPLILILMFAVGVSVAAGEYVDAAVIVVVILGSAALSFAQEFRADRAVAALLARVQIKATVLRDGQPVSIPKDEVVVGDVVLLSAGDLIPGDCVTIQAKGCFVDEAALTGETFPVEKSAGPSAENAALSERSNCLYMGTSVRSGTARALIIQVGDATAYGRIAQRLALRPPETEFERGVRKFGYLLVQIILVLVLFVFASNVFADKPPVESLLFAIALAVGIAPELLPAIITITLSTGAQGMAKQGVIVKRLNAIENFGNMDVLCTDKTGTLTEGVIRLSGVYDPLGEQASDGVFALAYVNASLQTGMRNPLDDAIVAYGRERAPDIGGYTKVDEIPYDFERRRLSVIVDDAQGQRWLVTKGAFAGVLDTCTRFDLGEQTLPLDETHSHALVSRYTAWGEQGFRVLGVARRRADAQTQFKTEDERDLSFVGFLLFFDPPKPGIRETLKELEALGVQLKIVTGDNARVGEFVAQRVGLDVNGVVTGTELSLMSDEALWHTAQRSNLYVEVDPNQKERIIRSLRSSGHVVGYMGDGINDAPALHVADVGISVDSAVDVAKEAADLVLLEHSLDILRDGIVSGRKTFANTLKYVFTTTSANFGNMLSMAGLALFLPFLPLLAKQILLNNFLSDIPGMAIASDAVDKEWIERPHRWDVRLIRNFMIVFGLVSSVFDYVTFAILLWVVQASPSSFRTAWFIESLLTELVIALVVRSRRPFWKSVPGRWLLLSTLAVAVLALALPYLPGISAVFEFVPLPLPLLMGLLAITAGYVAATELTKRWFYRRVGWA